MSDKSGIQGVGEALSSAMGNTADGIFSEGKKIVQTAASQVTPQKTKTPEEQKHEKEEEAKKQAELAKIRNELHEIAEKLDQPTPEELEKRRQEEQLRMAEEEEKKKKEQEGQAQPVALHGSNPGNSGDPLAVTQTRKEKKLGIGG